MTAAFCDGFEITVEEVNKDFAEASKTVLLESIQGKLEEMIVQNILLKSIKSGIRIWITLNPETTRLTPRTMTEIKKVVTAVEEHADTFWCLSDDSCSHAEITKIDVAVDLQGAFVPDGKHGAYQLIKRALE